MGERRRIELLAGEVATETAKPKPVDRDRPTSYPPPSIGTSLSGSDDTQRRLVVSLHEPLAHEPLPPNVVAQLEDESGLVHPLAKVRCVIGRGRDVDVHVDDPKASRKHASIFFTGTEFRVRDETSANGTLLNGSRVVEYAIRDGDELLIGDAFLRFRCRVG
jgi:hypothetical protein